MKKYFLIILCMLFILTGCRSKSFFSITFDEFYIKLYTNTKQYSTSSSDTNIVGMKVLAEKKEQTAKEDTGFINSFLIVKIPIQSGSTIKQIVDTNNKNLELRLLKYKILGYDYQKVSCDDVQYSGYVTSYSYLVDMQTIYQGQYFFADDESVYVISLSTDEPKDIDAFIKSVATTKCK